MHSGATRSGAAAGRSALRWLDPSGSGSGSTGGGLAVMRGPSWASSFFFCFPICVVAAGCFETAKPAAVYF